MKVAVTIHISVDTNPAASVAVSADESLRLVAQAREVLAAALRDYATFWHGCVARGRADRALIYRERADLAWEMYKNLQVEPAKDI